MAQLAAERLLRPVIEARGGLRDPIPEGGDEDDPATYRFPSGAVLHLAHHGDITGSNAWQAAVTVIVIGRPATNRTAGERQAEVIAGRACSVVVSADDSWWPTVPAGIRMADGTGRQIEKQPRHPDPLVEAVRWSTTEGAVLQAIGRARGVRRGPDQPVRVVVLAALALPLTVAEARTWEEIQPDRLTVAAAEAALMGRALPLAPADLARARNDLWSSAKAAERFMEGRCRFETPRPLISNSYKGLGGFKPLTLARYRTGLRGRWSLALVPVEAGQAALEALLGPLSAYEAIVAEQAAPARLEAALADAAPVPLPRPSLVLVPVSVATQRARLALLAQRLDAVRPKPTWGIRQMDWQAHQAAARAAAGLPGTDWQAWRAQARLAAG